MTVSAEPAHSATAFSGRASRCPLCGNAVTVGQRADKSGTAHATCAEDAEQVVRGLIGMFVTIGGQAPHVLPEERCMGRRCSRRAEFAVSAINERLALNSRPVRLCLPCLLDMDEDGRNVDFFRWLSENRIEATS